MKYTGELISLGVAVSWTITAFCFEFAGKRIGALSLNVIRLFLAIILLAITLFVFTGNFIPIDAGSKAWFWLAISGFIGYVLGDYCLFNSYILIGSRFGQLFMTLAPPSAAIAGMFVLGEKMSMNAIIGMIVTLFGIGLSIIGKDQNSSKGWHISLPIKGVLLGVGAGIGQGVGLVFSKLGMEYYMQEIELVDTTTSTEIIPFAATQIRAIVGFVGFTTIMLWKNKERDLVESVKDSTAMKVVLLGTVFGPFLGVSFSLMAVQYTEAGIASTLMALTPILILLPAYYFLKQKITMREVFGAIISVIGVSLFFI